MSVSIFKRKREERCIEDDNSDESNCSDSSQEHRGNGDTEIFSTLILLMEDLNVLKTCRLVCKSWNEFACRALRKLPWVYYPIDEYSQESNDKYRKLLVENKYLGLPSPFGNLLIRARSFREESFLRFLRYVRENTTSFSVAVHIVPHRADVDPIELQTVLTTNLHNFKITKLFIYSDIRIGDVFLPRNNQLPHLQLLSMSSDGRISQSILNLCEIIWEFSPLKSLQFDGTRPGENLRKFMRPGVMKSLENLSLTFERIDSEDSKYICERIMEIPSIKKLKLYFHQHDSDNDYCSGFEAIVDHFANKLESLTGECLPLFKNKSFPKLRDITYIRFSNFNNEFSLPVERYPLLKRATFVVERARELEYPSVGAESLGIEELSLQFVDCPDSEKILKFISTAGMVFPNVSSLSIVQTGQLYFTSSVLDGISKFFPKLTTLELWAGKVTCSTLTGLPVAVKKWLRTGWPLEKIPRQVSLLDFPGLEKLSFGPDVVISEELLMCCLSKMPKLQYLTFYLNKLISLPAEIIRDYVGHLKRITILKSLKSYDDPQNVLVKETERLRIMLPSVVEIRKIPLESPQRFSRAIERILERLMKFQ